MPCPEGTPPHISPHSAMTTCSLGLLFGPVITFSILRMTSMPSPRMRPNTTCLLSSQSVFACATHASAKPQQQQQGQGSAAWQPSSPL